VLHGLGQLPRYETFLASQVESGEIVVDVDPVPVAQIEAARPRAGSDRRIVFVP
jgi:hypothetical protein